MNKEHINSKLSQACLAILKKEKITNQRELKHFLIKKGFENINQSLISKLLAELGVIKIANAKGEKVYALNNADLFCSINRTLKEQILTISSNDVNVIVKTQEGFAQAIEQFFKCNCQGFILTCISGFNSLLVLPAKNISSKQCEQQIRKCFNL